MAKKKHFSMNLQLLSTRETTLQEDAELNEGKDQLMELLV